MKKDSKKYLRPLVSIILSTYNRAKFIRKAIESVLNQSYKDFEFVVVNDACQDDTLKILKSYNDPRIKIINNELNLGFVKSLNKAINCAKGEYIARIDDDDYWSDSKKLEKQIAFLENNPEYVLVGCGMIKINKQGQEIKRYLFPEKDQELRRKMLLTDYFVHPGVVFRKKDWEAVGGYNEQFYFSQDWDLWARLGKMGKMYNFPECFVSLRESGENRTTNKMGYHLFLNQKIRKKYSRDYPHFWRYYLLGWGAYLIKPLFLKIKQFYEEFKNKKN